MSLSLQQSSTVNITLHQRGSNQEKGMSGVNVEPSQVCTGQLFWAATPMTGKEERTLASCCCNVGGLATRGGRKREERRREKGRAHWGCHQPVWIRPMEHVWGNQHEASHLEEKTTKSSPQYDRPRLHQV